MFFLVASIAVLGPLIACALTFLCALVLVTSRPALGTILLGLFAAVATLMLFEFQYDLGLTLPDFAWMPTGARSEGAMMLLIVALCLTLVWARVKWPVGKRHRWLATSASMAWALVLGAFSILSQLSYSP